MIYKARVKIQKPKKYGIFETGFSLATQYIYVEADSQNQARALIEREYGKFSCLSMPVPVDEDEIT